MHNVSYFPPLELPTFARFLRMKRTLLHLQFWLAYVLALTYLNVTSDVTHFDPLPDEAWAQFVNQFVIQSILLLVKVPFVYAFLYLLSEYLRQKLDLPKIVAWLIPLLALGAVALSTVNHKLVLPYVLNITETRYSIFSTGSLVYHALALAFITGIAASFKLIRWQHRTQVNLATLQAEKVEAELRYLKGQINPHFLFNTLNNLYALARKKSDQTPESILKLSKLMRFTLYEANRPTIPIEDELRLIKDYIELEKLRYTDRLTISYHEAIDNLRQPITPLLLIHFVENAFKHGVSETNQASFITIDIQLRSLQLDAVIVNSNSAERHDTPPPLGMENIKRQLALIYPGHALRIDNQPETFRVHLSIPLPSV